MEGMFRKKWGESSRQAPLVTNKQNMKNHSSSLRRFWIYLAFISSLRRVTDGFSNCCLFRHSWTSFVLLHLRLNCFRDLSILSPSFTITLSICCFSYVYLPPIQDSHLGPEVCLCFIWADRRLKPVCNYIRNNIRDITVKINSADREKVLESVPIPVQFCRLSS